MALSAIANHFNQKKLQPTASDAPVPNNLKNASLNLISYGQDIFRRFKNNYQITRKLNHPEFKSAEISNILSEQISLALNRKLTAEKSVTYINYDINEGCLALMLHIAEECEIEISLYRTSLFHRLSETSLYLAKLSPGERFIKFDKKALYGFGAKFMAVKVQGKIFYMKRI